MQVRTRARRCNGSERWLQRTALHLDDECQRLSSLSRARARVCSVARCCSQSAVCSTARGLIAERQRELACRSLSLVKGTTRALKLYCECSRVRRTSNLRVGAGDAAALKRAGRAPYT